MKVETGHVQLLISYSLRADVEEADYETWVRQVAVAWWQDQPGFRSIRGFYTVIGTGARIFVQIDFDHLESVVKVLGSPGYGEMRREFGRFAEDVDTRLLAPTGRIPD